VVQYHNNASGPIKTNLQAAYGSLDAGLFTPALMFAREEMEHLWAGKFFVFSRRYAINFYERLSAKQRDDCNHNLQDRL
jgi:predicted sulfurtransferase